MGDDGLSEHPEVAILSHLPRQERTIYPLKDPGKFPEVLQTFLLTETVQLEALLPRPGAPDEPKWLMELRKDAGSDLDWTLQDEEELLSVANFSVRFKSVEITSLTYDDGNNDEDRMSLEGLLVLLENLEWK
jgi:hypothetical protein